MGGAAALLQRGDELVEHLVVRERAIGDGLVDARQVLHDDAARAQVHVTYFGIAHLPARQADGKLARCDVGVGEAREKLVPVRGGGQADGVVGTLGALAPAIENTQHDGTRTMGFRHARLIEEPPRGG